MRMKIGWVAGLAVLAAAAAPAQAQTCGGSNFKTCATVAINAVQDGANVKVSFTVTNNAGLQGTYAGSVITQIGIFGLRSGTGFVSGQKTSGSGNFSFGLSPNGLSGTGIMAVVAGADANQGINGGLAAGQTITFEIVLSNVTLAQVQAALNDWAIHVQGGPNDCSTKLVVTNGVPNDGPYDPSCGTPPTTTIPEPATLALLGSGLMSLAGGAAARRRKARS